MGEDEELILGAFLHDIMATCSAMSRRPETMGNFGVVNHEGVGAEYLRAKRFLRTGLRDGRKKHVDANVTSLQQTLLTVANYQKPACKH